MDDDIPLPVQILGLPAMEGSAQDEGAGEALGKEAQHRFVLLDAMRRCREDEAKSMREGRLKQAEEHCIRGREIAEKMHRQADAVQLAWDRVAPSLLEKEAAGLSLELEALSDECARGRNYDEACELKEAKQRALHAHRIPLFAFCARVQPSKRASY